MILKCYNRFKQIKHLSYTWDSQLIEHLINDIQYFESIYLLSKEDILLLKQEIYTFLNDMETISIQGEFSDTHNKVELFISQITIDTNYCYSSSSGGETSAIKVFTKYTAICSSEAVCENFKKWVQIHRRNSIPISRVNEQQRIVFFKQQRELLNRLSDSPI